jgi:hypothetical protein
VSGSLRSARRAGPGNCDPLPDALEGFQGDPPLSVSGFRHNRLRELVIEVTLEARLLPFEGAQFAFGCAASFALRSNCAFQLQVAQAVGILPPELVDLRSGKFLLIAAARIFTIPRSQPSQSFASCSSPSGLSYT